MKILFLDCETSDLIRPNDENKSPFEQPWIVQIAIMLADDRHIYHLACFTINSLDREINPHAEKVHGISREMTACGVSEKSIAALIGMLLDHASKIVAHNTAFDISMLMLLLRRQGMEFTAQKLKDFNQCCTMKISTDFCALPGRYGKPKWPKLTELHEKLFGQPFDGAHNALADVMAVRSCYYALKDLAVISD